jgi:hypothetical protein
MTARELIEQLQSIDPDAEVRIVDPAERTWFDPDATRLSIAVVLGPGDVVPIARQAQRLEAREHEFAPLVRP